MQLNEIECYIYFFSLNRAVTSSSVAISVTCSAGGHPPSAFTSCQLQKWSRIVCNMQNTFNMLCLKYLCYSYNNMHTATSTCQIEVHVLIQLLTNNLILPQLAKSRILRRYSLCKTWLHSSKNMFSKQQSRWECLCLNFMVCQGYRS